MNTNTIFKTIGFAGFVLGTGAIAFAVYKRNEKTKLQEATAEALVLADMAKDIAKENFSGANGESLPTKTYLCSDGKRKWFSRTPCTKGGITPPKPTCEELLKAIDKIKILIRENGTNPRLIMQLAQFEAQYKEMCGGNPLGRITKEQCESWKPSGHTCKEGADGSWRYDKF